jgi:hypothetical protein
VFKALFLTSKVLKDLKELRDLLVKEFKDLRDTIILSSILVVLELVDSAQIVSIFNLIHMEPN